MNGASSKAPGAVLVHVQFRQARRNEELTEFVRLARSAGLAPLDTITGRRDRPGAKFFIGSGKVEEIKQSVRERQAEVAVFNHSLSPAQERNLEREICCRALDRVGLILDIFSQRARTYEGKLQVELAQLQHLSTRLVRGWSHLERQKGGIGLRGPGETQLETDRRLIGKRIKSIGAQLQKVKGRRAQGRRLRKRNRLALVSLVGYTNAGKSTLFNALTNAAVAVEDKLFATVDPTLRRLAVPGAGQVVLADTVGFVSRLPHSLIDAFKATLEEVTEADLLVHVMDAASAELEQRVEDVEAVLRDIGAEGVPRIDVLNKWDLAGQAPPVPNALPISAAQGLGLDELLSRIGRALGVFAPIEVRLPTTAGSTRAWLHASGAVLDETSNGNGEMRLRVRGDERLLKRLRRDLGDLQAVLGSSATHCNALLSGD